MRFPNPKRKFPNQKETLLPPAGHSAARVAAGTATAAVGGEGHVVAACGGGSAHFPEDPGAGCGDARLQRRRSVRGDHQGVAAPGGRLESQRERAVPVEAVPGAGVPVRGVAGLAEAGAALETADRDYLARTSLG